MLFKNRSLLSITTATLLTTNIALADSSPKDAYQVSPEQLAQAEQNGYFAGLDLGYALIDWNSFLTGTDVTSGKDGGFTFVAKGGYRWNHRVAMETGLQYLPGVDYSEDNKSYSISQWLSYVVAELDAPIYKKTNAFVQAGLGYHYVDDDQNGSDSTIKPYYAFGVAYKVNAKWEADLKCSFFSTDEEINGHTGYIPTINSVMLGAKYLF